MTTCLSRYQFPIIPFSLVDPEPWEGGGGDENSPSTGLQSHAAATLLTASVTCQFLLPTRTRRIATSAAVHAARNASARRPVTGLANVAPTTIVSALIAAKPSMCAPRCTFTTSPLASFCADSGSELRACDCQGREGEGIVGERTEKGGSGGASLLVSTTRFRAGEG
jgi:hypothetical protein